MRQAPSREIGTDLSGDDHAAMSVRFIKWLIVVLIAAAIVVALDRLFRPDPSAGIPAMPVPGIHQNAEIPATPIAPAVQAESMSDSFMPPRA